MTFADLITAFNSACTDDDKAAADEKDADALYVAAREHKIKTAEAKDAASKAIHDFLAERGPTSLIGKDRGNLVYLASDQPPGWYTVQPIPGNDVKVKQETVAAK